MMEPSQSEFVTSNGFGFADPAHPSCSLPPSRGPDSPGRFGEPGLPVITRSSSPIPLSPYRPTAHVVSSQPMVVAATPPQRRAKET
jgi:hypothetical protein